MESLDKNNSFNLFDFFKYILNEHKLTIPFFSIFISLIVLIITLFMEDKFESSALVIPTNSSETLGSENNLFSIGLFQENTFSPETKRALAVLESRSFFNELYEDNNFLSVLVCDSALKSGELIVNSRCFKTDEGVWINKPQKLEAFGKFWEDFSYESDYSTGYLEFKMLANNPSAAQFLLSKTIIKLNTYERIRAANDAAQKSKYLNNKIASTSISELRRVFADAINKQNTVLMLSEISDEFIFQYIDPPSLPVIKKSPNRIFLIILSFFSSALASVLILLTLFNFNLIAVLSLNDKKIIIKPNI